MRRPRLERQRVLPVRSDLDLDQAIRSRHLALESRCLHATFDSDISRCFRVNERRARRERRIGADDRRRLFDLDLDEVGNVLRLIPA